MRAASVGPAALTLALACAAHAAPRGDVPSAGARDPELIEEMRKRRVIGPDQAEWNAEEYTLLLRVREAQSLDAFGLLRRKLATLKGFAAQSRSGGEERLFLTVEGYRRYRFLRSQEARAYFESRAVAAREVFALRDTAGKALFDGSGQLTQEGETLYNRVQRKLPAFWTLPDGSVGGNARPPMDASKPAAPPPAAGAPPVSSRTGSAPSTEAPSAASALDEESARRKLETLKATGYVEITPKERDALLSATGLAEEELVRRSSLQAVASPSWRQYLLSPSDPLFALVAQGRAR